MIKYNSGIFGFQLLFRFDGSAVFKSVLPAISSSIIYVVLHFIFDDEQYDVPIMFHPYPMGALIAALTFLLSFRANFSYNRYWEALSSVHTMHSRWIDVGIEVSAFHLQSSFYDTDKPISFGTIVSKDPKLNSVPRNRERTNELTLQELEKTLDQLQQQQEELQLQQQLQQQNEGGDQSIPIAPLDDSTSSRRRLIRSRIRNNRFLRKVARIIKKDSVRRNPIPLSPVDENTSINTKSSVNNEHESTKASVSLHNPRPTQNNSNKVKTKVVKKQLSTLSAASSVSSNGPMKSINAVVVTNGHRRHHRKVNFLQRLGSRSDSDDNDDSNKDEHSENHPQQNSIISTVNTKKVWKQSLPPLFLQEAAHLLSLLSAVALSTLRNDLEGAESPLTTFTPGAPWPHVDPDSYGADVRKGWIGSGRSWWYVSLLKYLFNISRTPASRTLYNAARPFRVIGGVSDTEVELLRAARGPSAKVALVFMWLLEYITRECRYGSTGSVSPPILTRMYQLASDGMSSYNQARKVAYIPFPFPHAQITALFTMIVTFFMPILMLQFVSDVYFGFVLNFVTVMCFTGLQEVSRELESPFLNVPNDIPLNNFQAQYNESLLTMFAGYHPDAYWDVTADATTKLEDEKDVLIMGLNTY